jgi:hypothetical protein
VQNHLYISWRGSISHIASLHGLIYHCFWQSSATILKWVSEWVRILLWQCFRKNYSTYPVQTLTYYLDGHRHFVENHVFKHYSLTIADKIVTCRTKVHRVFSYLHFIHSHLYSNWKWPTGGHFVFPKLCFQNLLINYCRYDNDLHNQSCSVFFLLSFLSVRFGFRSKMADWSPFCFFRSLHQLQLQLLHETDAGFVAIRQHFSYASKLWNHVTFYTAWLDAISTILLVLLKGRDLHICTQPSYQAYIIVHPSINKIWKMLPNVNKPCLFHSVGQSAIFYMNANVTDENESREMYEQLWFWKWLAYLQ